MHLGIHVIYMYMYLFNTINERNIMTLKGTKKIYRKVWSETGDGRDDLILLQSQKVNKNNKIYIHSELCLIPTAV